MDAASLEQAVQAAEELLNRHRDCECVEIFHGNQFLGEVDRPAAR